MLLDDQYMFTVTDIKQYSYCPRVVFYERCLPHLRPRTYKMDAGRDAHEAEERRAIRRNLSKYEVKAGKRFFNVSLTSHTLNLTGNLDEVVQTTENEVFPVDYKLAKKVSPNHRLQLAAYALLLEEIEQVQVQRGFIYLIISRLTVEVPFTPSLRDEIRALLERIQKMVIQEEMPSPTQHKGHCLSCEFRRFCNDV